MRINVVTVVGLVGAVSLLWFVLASEGDMLRYLNLTGFVIVFGGVMVAALIAFQGRELLAALRAFGAIFRADPGMRAEIAELIEVSRLLASSEERRGGKAGGSAGRSRGAPGP